jgi:hypothetical protein
MAALSILFQQALHELDEQLQQCHLEVGSSSFLKSERDRQADYLRNKVKEKLDHYMYWLRYR